MGKTPEVVFRPKLIAEGDWQIEAHYPGAEIRYVTGLTSKADIDDWMGGSRKIAWLRSQGYAKKELQDRARLIIRDSVSSTSESEMAKGTVKWFNPTKGYGFIQPTSGGGKDVFVHISAVERAGLSSLNEGQVVEYEIESSRGKESAINLKVK